MLFWPIVAEKAPPFPPAFAFPPTDCMPKAGALPKPGCGCETGLGAGALAAPNAKEGAEAAPVPNAGAGVLAGAGAEKGLNVAWGGPPKGLGLAPGMPPLFAPAAGNAEPCSPPPEEAAPAGKVLPNTEGEACGWNAGVLPKVNAPAPGFGAVSFGLAPSVVAPNVKGTGEGEGEGEGALLCPPIAKEDDGVPPPRLNMPPPLDAFPSGAGEEAAAEVAPNVNWGVVVGGGAVVVGAS